MSQSNGNHDNSRACKRTLEGEEDSRGPRDPRRRTDEAGRTPRPVTGFCPITPAPAGNTPRPTTAFRPTLFTAPAPVAQSSPRAPVPGPPKDPRPRPEVPAFKAPTDPRPRPNVPAFVPPKDPRPRPNVPTFVPPKDPKPRPEPQKDSRQLPVVPGFGAGSAPPPRGQHMDTPRPTTVFKPTAPAFGAGSAPPPRGQHKDTPRPTTVFTPSTPTAVVRSSAGAAGGAVAVQHQEPQTFKQLLFGHLSDLAGLYRLNPNRGPFTTSCKPSRYSSFCCFRIIAVWKLNPHRRSDGQVRLTDPRITECICGVYAELTLDYFEVHLPEGACRLRIFCRLGEGAQDAPAYLVWSPVTIRIYSGNHPLPLVFPTGKITPPTLSFQTLELDIGGETCYVEFGPPQYDLDVLHNPVSMPNSKIGMVVQDQHLHRRFVDGVVPGGYSAQMLTKYLVWLALQWFIHRYRRHPDVANPADVKRVNDHLVNEILRQNVKTFDFWLPYWRVQENILEYLELFCNPMYVRYSRPATLITVTPETAQMATEAPLLPSRMFLQMYEYNPLAEAGRRLQVAAEANTLSYTFDPAGRTFICFKIKAYMQKSENDPIWPETSEFQGWYAKPFVGGEERFDKVYGGSRAYIEVSETRIRLCSPDREVSFPHPKGFDEPWNMVSLDEVKISLPDEIMILKFLPFRWGEDLNDLLDPAPWNSFEKNIKDHYIACNKEKWIFPRYVCYKSEDPNIPALKMSAEEFARNAYMSLIPKHIAKFRLNRTIICGHMLGVLRMEFEKSFSPRVFNYLVDNGIYQPADWINTFKQMFGFGIRVYPRGWCSGSRRDEDGAAGGGGGGGGARGGGGDGGRGDGGWGGGN